MKNNIYKKLAFKKVGFSLLIVLIYSLGSHLIIPGGDSSGLTQLMGGSPNLSFALSMTGLSLSQLSLFSLGLGPWMSALIFWRVLSVTKIFHIQNMTNQRSYQIKFIFSLLLGGVQSFTIIAQLKNLNGGQLALPYWELILLLVSGLAALIWLGNLNAQYGIGGPTIIILVSMVRDWPGKIISTLSGESALGMFSHWLFPFLLVLLFSFGVFRFYQGERRLPLTHVMLDDQFAEEAYLPIPTNPAGGMPFMFAFSVVLFPQYFFFILKGIYQGNRVLGQLYQEVQLDHLLGVGFLILSIVLLTYGFSYVNIDYKEISESLKKSGDYFYDVYPGKNTERFLFHKVSMMATIAALFNAFIIGVPMLTSIYFSNVSVWAYFIPTWLILIILMRELGLQFTSLYHRNDYQPMIKEENK